MRKKSQPKKTGTAASMVSAQPEPAAAKLKHPTENKVESAASGTGSGPNLTSEAAVPRELEYLLRNVPSDVRRHAWDNLVRDAQALSRRDSGRPEPLRTLLSGAYGIGADVRGGLLESLESQLMNLAVLAEYLSEADDAAFCQSMVEFLSRQLLDMAHQVSHAMKVHEALGQADRVNAALESGKANGSASARAVVEGALSDTPAADHSWLLDQVNAIAHVAPGAEREALRQEVRGIFSDYAQERIVFGDAERRLREAFRERGVRLRPRASASA